jgi:hypothetical protein
MPMPPASKLIEFLNQLSRSELAGLVLHHVLTI